MRILITGVTGFVGSYLAEYILNMGQHQVWGLRRWRSDLSGVAHLASRIHWIECELHDAGSVKRAIHTIKPHRIFHLAAQSYVPSSWHAPTETLIDNLIGELNVLEAVRDLKQECRVQIAGSSEEYGLVRKQDLPVKEDVNFRPLSPYAVSKIGQDMLAYQYHQSYKLHVVRTRAFNHDGPGRPDVFVASGFAKQVALIEAGRQEPIIHVGNLSTIRDFLDVRDVVRAYWLALEKGQSGEVYNVCSGRGWSMAQVLQTLLKVAHLRVQVRKDPSRMRPSDVPIMIGDNSKFRKATGWKPEIRFEETLQDLLNSWRIRIQQNGFSGRRAA